MFLGCFWGDSGVFPGCFWDVSGMFVECFRGVSGLFPGCFWGVFGVFRECFWCVSGVCSRRADNPDSRMWLEMSSGRTSAHDAARNYQLVRHCHWCHVCVARARIECTCQKYILTRSRIARRLCSWAFPIARVAADAVGIPTCYQTTLSQPILHPPFVCVARAVAIRQCQAGPRHGKGQ